MRIRERLAWGVAAALGLFVVAAMAGVATSGPLDPPDPVGSTMKTLEEIPGSWSRALSSDGADPCNTERFRCVLNNEAVLDLETGLVWERVPDTATTLWLNAFGTCQFFDVAGDRFGWRLPEVEELSTLLIPGQGLPANHPFTASGEYWSATRVATVDKFVYAVDFDEGEVSGGDTDTAQLQVWCVRGPGI